MVGLAERVVGQATIGLSRGAGGEVLAAGREIASGSIVRTNPGSYASLRFEPDVSIRLDADTDLRIAAPRVFELERGAIYIDSGLAEQRRLEVRTSLGTARDVGTRFEVRLVDSSLRVRVRDGLVSLEHRGLSYEARPGMELLASDGGPLTRRMIALHGPDWDWTLRAVQPFALEGRTLDTFLQWVEREGGWRVTFSDQQLERSATTILLHGSIDGLTPEAALSAVLPTCGLRHRVAGDALVIERQ